MDDQQPRRTPETHQPARQGSSGDAGRAREVPEGMRPTINQPINAEPRARLAPALVAGIIVAGIIVLILALTLL